MQLVNPEPFPEINDFPREGVSRAHGHDLGEVVLGEIAGEGPGSISPVFVEEGVLLLEFLHEPRVHLLEPNRVIRTHDHLPGLYPGGIYPEPAVQRIRPGIGVGQEVGAGVRNFPLGVEIRLEFRPLVFEVGFPVLRVDFVLIEQDISDAGEGGLLQSRLLFGEGHRVAKHFSASFVLAGDDAVLAFRLRDDEVHLLRFRDEWVEQVAIELDRGRSNVHRVAEKQNDRRPGFLPKGKNLSAHERRRFPLVPSRDDLIDWLVPSIDGGVVDVNVIPILHTLIIRKK